MASFTFTIGQDSLIGDPGSSDSFIVKNLQHVTAVPLDVVSADPDNAGTADRLVFDLGGADSIAGTGVGNYLLNLSQEGQPPPANLVGKIDPANLILSSPAEVTVEFARSLAGFQSLLGWYTFDAAGNIDPTSIRFIWTDTTAAAPTAFPGLASPDFLANSQPSVVSLGTVPAGKRIGFFLVADGADDSSNIAVLRAAAGNYVGQSYQTDLAKINAATSFAVDADGNGVISVGGDELQGPTYFTHQRALNSDRDAPNDIDHALAGLFLASGVPDGKLYVGFEDSPGGGDRDFNDVVFRVDLGAGNLPGGGPVGVPGPIVLGPGYAGVSGIEIISFANSLPQTLIFPDASFVTNNSDDSGTLTIEAQNLQSLTADASAIGAVPRHLTFLLGAGSDSVRGSGGGDLFRPGAGADTIVGGGGDDRLIIDVADLGASDSFNGGGGTDRLEVLGSWTLSTGTGALAGVAGFEGFTFGVNGDGARNLTVTAAYASTLAGPVLIEVGSGQSQPLTVQAGSLSAAHPLLVTSNLGTSADLFTGGAAADSLAGGGGTDMLMGGGGNDSLDGGAGFDTARYAGPPSNHVLQILGGAIFVLDRTGSEGRDSLLAIEQLDFATQLIAVPLVQVGPGGILTQAAALDESVVGGAGNDTLTTGVGNDTLDGLGGDDSLVAGSGNDSLIGGDGNDTLDAGGGNDTLDGGLGADGLLGGDGNDLVAAGEGDDVVDGGIGNDTINGGLGNDSLLGGDGNDSLMAGDGNDSLDGGIGSDTLDGGLGADSLLGGDGNDHLGGGGDNDTLAGGLGNDTLDGGGGTDMARFAGSPSNYVLQILVGQLFLLDTAGSDGRDALIGIEQLAFPAQTIALPLVVVGPGGILAEASVLNESVVGGAGNDTLSTGGGTDTLDGAAGNDSLAAGAGDDRLLGGSGNDTLDGGLGNDTLDGGEGNDSLAAGDGDDSLIGGGGDNTLDGGAGTDTASFAGPSSAYVLQIIGGQIFVQGIGSRDALSGIEQLSFSSGTVPVPLVVVGPGGILTAASVLNESVVGGNGDDTLTTGTGTDTIIGGLGDDSLVAGPGADSLAGGGGNDSALGGEGNDTITGEGGNDTLAGEGGNDSIDGGDGNDRIDAGIGNDSMAGAAGNDSFEGGAGSDRIDGGAGNDTVHYLGPSSSYLVEVDGDTTTVTNLTPGSTDVDTLTGIEFLAFDDGLFPVVPPPAPEACDTIMGSDANDTLAGGTCNDSVIGGEGNDSVDGGAGNDTIIGGPGNDTVSGGPGNDSIILGPGMNQGDGGDGDDLIDITGSGGSTVAGGTGNDTVVGGPGDFGPATSIDGGDGNGDTIQLGSPGTLDLTDLGGLDGIEVMQGTNGDDVFVVTDPLLDGMLVIDGGDGIDTIVTPDPSLNLSDITLVGIEWVTTTNNDGTQFQLTVDQFVGLMGIVGGQGFDTIILTDGNLNQTTAGPGFDGTTGIDKLVLPPGTGQTLILTDTFLNQNGMVIGGQNVFEIDPSLVDGVIIDGSGLTNPNNALLIDCSDGNDLILGGAGNDTIYLCGGDDTIRGLGGDDTLVVQDAAFLSSGDAFYGGAGRDRLVIAAAATFIDLRIIAVLDSIEQVDAPDTGLALILPTQLPFIANGGAGADLFVGGTVGDLISGGGSNDTIFGGGGADTLVGDEGDDIIVGDDPTGTPGSSPGPDLLDGGSGADLLFGAGLNDTITGGLGNDTAVADSGDDLVDGGAGDDVIYGGAGADTLYGGQGNDVLVGALADELDPDYLDGGAGDDTIFGGNGADTLVGADGNDVLNAGAGMDILSGGDGNDVLVGYRTPGEADADLLLGGNGNDSLYGGGGADWLMGEAGNDWLIGDAGDDRLEGGSGNDSLVGGAGADLLVLRPGEGQDVAVDFARGQDHIDVTAFGFASPAALQAAATLTPYVNAITIAFGANAGVTLVGITDFSAGDFLI